MWLQKLYSKTDNQIDTIHKKAKIRKLGNGRPAFNTVTKIHSYIR